MVGVSVSGGVTVGLGGAPTVGAGVELVDLEGGWRGAPDGGALVGVAAGLELSSRNAIAAATPMTSSSATKPTTPVRTAFDICFFTRRKISSVRNLPGV